MNLSEREKKLLSALMLLIIISLVYLYGYTPFINKAKALKSDIKGLESQLDLLQGGTEGKSNSDLAAITNEVQKLDALLPPDLAQERVLLILKELSNSTDINFQSITFSDVKPAKIQISSNSADNDSSGPPKINDGTVIMINANIKCAATYNQIKYLLDKIATHNNKIVVSDLVLKSQPTGDIINGEFNLAFYAYKDSTKSLPEWNSNVNTGKSDIFK